MGLSLLTLLEYKESYPVGSDVAMMIPPSITKDSELLALIDIPRDPEEWNDIRLCIAAIHLGSRRILDFLIRKGCPYSVETTNNAALCNSRGLLMHCILVLGMPMDETTCTAAVMGCNWERLEWLRSITPPCPWDENVLITALALRNELAFLWACNNGCPAGVTLFKEAIKYNSNMAPIDILNENGHFCHREVWLEALREKLDSSLLVY